MKALRDGSRQNPIMSLMAKGLTDADIDNVAAYYSGLRCP
ncbi:MAG: c-type cytochrome [Bacillota bacterium]